MLCQITLLGLEISQFCLLNYVKYTQLEVKNKVFEL